MSQIIGAVLLGFAGGLIIGMFIGENWSKWDRASRRKYQDEHEDWWDTDTEKDKPAWLKKQAD